jgi:exosome complex component CSL4
MADIAVPGEFLGTEEEFAQGEHTFDEDGRIYAGIAGKQSLDKSRRCSIAPSVKVPHRVSQGSVVYGIIAEIFEPVAIVRLVGVENERGRQVVPDSAVIHASGIRQGYVKNVRDELRIGDIVKATVSEVRPHGIYLSTKEKSLGVVKAFCTRCRAPLALSGRDLLCGSCGNREYRKLAVPYRA